MSGGGGGGGGKRESVYDREEVDGVERGWMGYNKVGG